MRFLKLALSVIREHIAALLFAFLVGFLLGMPALLAAQALGETYQGIPFLFQDNENLYLARIQEVRDGHPTLGSPFVAEYKDSPTMLTSNGEHVYVYLTAFTGLSLPTIVVISKFVFPAILFLLVYALTFLLAVDIRALYPRMSAVAAASLVVVGIDFLQPSYIWHLMSMATPELYLSPWTRIVNPITGGLFLFSFFICTVLILQRRAWAPFWAGIALGLMSGYIFSFAIALSMIGVLGAFHTYTRQWDIVKTCVLTVLVGAAINIAQFKNFFSILGSSMAHEFSLRNGLLVTHAPLLNKWLCVALFLLVTTVLMRRAFGAKYLSIAEIWIGSVFVSLLLVMNQQILTGVTVWPQHFAQFSVPIIFISLTALCGAIAYQYRARVTYIWAAFLVAILITCLLFGYKMMGTYTAVMPEYVTQQRSAGALAWLRENAPKECSVFAIESFDLLARMVPAYTHCNTYETIYVFVGLPRERIVHNYFMHLRFMGLTAKNAPSYFATHTDEFRVLLFSDWEELFWHNGNPWLESISDRPQVFEKYTALGPVLSKEYQANLKKDFLQELKQYALQYVIWDSIAFPDWDPKKFPFLTEVYNQQGIYIYATP